jgi:putative addiction module CopG family antidote
MPSKSTITASLTPELTALIAAKVKTGHYRSASEVVRAALRLLVELDRRQEGNFDQGGPLPVNVMQGKPVAPVRSSPDSPISRLGPFIQHAPGMIAVLSGPDHVFEFANAAYLDLVGGRDVIEKQLRDALPELEERGVVAQLDRVYASGEPFVGRRMPVAFHRQVDAPPEIRYIDFVYQPVTDGLDRVIGIFAQGFDVTAQVATEAALRESEAHFAAIFDQTAAGLAEGDLSGRILRVNDRFCELVGYTREELLSGLRMQDITHPGDLPENLRLFQRAVETGEPFLIEKRYIRRDGSEVWVSNTVTLIYDEARQPRTVVSVSIDVTARRAAEAALRQSEARLRVALDAGRMGIWATDTLTNAVTTSPEFNRLFGFPEDAAPTLDEIRSRYAPGTLERLHAVAYAALERGARHAEEELEVVWPDGSHHWLLLRSDMELTVGPDGATYVKATGVAFEITERKRWEERQRLLINELNHRVKNTLATVQSIAVQSFREMDAASCRNSTTFQDRLFALARAHDLLTRDNWEGAELGEVIGEVIEPYCRESGGRCETDGPHVRLTPSMALALSMAVHELATNAAKYGALSVPTGRVSISWTVRPHSPRSLCLRWREYGGPPVASPVRKGFGSRLIECSLASDLSGEVDLAFVATGVVCTIKAPFGNSMY